MVFIFAEAHFVFSWVCFDQTTIEKQARKSSEEAQAAGFARFEKVWTR